MTMSSTDPLPLHHIKHEYCETRPKYRRGNKRTSVRVFTVNVESKYIIVSGVPSTGLEKDLVKLFASFGMIVQCQELKDYPREDFTQVFLIQYKDIQAAKHAKKRLDEHQFYGSMLHVFYAPEYETVSDTREKIIHRRHSVISRVKFLKREANEINLKRGKKDKNKNKSKAPPVKDNTSDCIKNSTSYTKNVSTSLTASKKQEGSLNQANVEQFNKPSLEPYHNIPKNVFGIPLFLPPPPPPSYMEFKRVFPTHQYPSFPSSHLYTAPLHHGAKRSHPFSASNPPSVTIDTGPPAPPPPKKKKPELKTRSGYFYQKVLNVLSSKPSSSKVNDSNVATSSTSFIQSKKTQLPVIETPSFLPRSIELQQIEDFNKVDTDAAGNIPLLGSFLLEKNKSQVVKEEHVSHTNHEAG